MPVFARDLSLVETVPNVSEGRRQDVVEDLASAIRSVQGTRLLDYSADPAHHRSVFTLAGDGQAVERAVLSVAARAIALVDLRLHRGEHPRIGALDVVPFVPLGRTTMAACVALAKQAGREI